MIKVNNLMNNANLVKTESRGCFDVLEHQKDMSVNPYTAQYHYFMTEMNFKKRQLLCKLQGNAVKIQGGAMQWMTGNLNMDADVKDAMDFLGKAVKGLATGESITKPVYEGRGAIMLEPTYRYILFEDVAEWGEGLVVDDGMFLACDASVEESVVARKNISTALLGGEGLFNLKLSGSGIAVLESIVPREELIEIVLDNDVAKIDGNHAVAWSASLDFAVEKSSSSLVNSAISGEGLVNVYRGSGRILMAPTVCGGNMRTGNSPKEHSRPSSHGLVSSVISSIM